MTRPMSEEERERLAAKLRVTTEQMAHRCSVDQVLWNMHSNACLEAADALSISAAERGMREALAEDLGMVEHDGALLLLPAPAEERHCFECTSRSACRNNGSCGLGWHNTHSIRAYRAALSEQARGQGRSESTDTKGTSK